MAKNEALEHNQDVVTKDTSAQLLKTKPWNTNRIVSKTQVPKLVMTVALVFKDSQILSP